MTAVGLPSIARRLSAMLYEGLVVFSILLIGFLIPQIVLSGHGIQFSGRMLWLHVFLLLAAYFLWCWLHGGQTLPMKTWKMRLSGSREHCLKIRPAQALLRYFLAWPSILLGGIGLIWAIFDKDRQFLHDRIAGTYIVTAKDPQEAQNA